MIYREFWKSEISQKSLHCKKEYISLLVTVKLSDYGCSKIHNKNIGKWRHPTTKKFYFLKQGGGSNYYAQIEAKQNKKQQSNRVCAKMEWIP